MKTIRPAFSLGSAAILKNIVLMDFAMKAQVPAIKDEVTGTSC